MHSQPTRFTLYSGPLSMFGAKAQIAALEKGLDFDLIMVAYDSHLGYSPKHPEVLRINPKGQVPVLAHDGLELFDSTQILSIWKISNRRRRCGRATLWIVRARVAWSTSPMKCISRTSFASWVCGRILTMPSRYRASKRPLPTTVKWRSC